MSESGGDDDWKTLQLPEVLTIQEVALITREWQSHAFADSSLDASQVRNIDTAGIQLTIALVRELAERGHRILWQPEPSAVFIEATETLGLQQTLGLPESC